MKRSSGRLTFPIVAALLRIAKVTTDMGLRASNAHLVEMGSEIGELALKIEAAGIELLEGRRHDTD